MFTVKQMPEFAEWSGTMRDQLAKAAIQRRIKNAQKGNLGVVRAVGEGVSEMKIDFGPGYRIYFTKHGQTIIILLCGGDKSSQSRDIEKAKKIVKEIKP